MGCAGIGCVDRWVVFHHLFPSLLMTETAVCGGVLRVHGVSSDVISFDLCHPRAGLVCDTGWREQTPEHLQEAPPYIRFPGESTLWRLEGLRRP